MIGTDLLTVDRPVLDSLQPVVPNLLTLRYASLTLDAIGTNLLALGDASLALDSIGADLLAVRYPSLTLDATGASLLALGHAVLEALGMGRPLRHAFGAELLALDAGGARLTLDRHALCPLAAATALDRLTRSRAAFDRLGSLALGRRGLLLIGLAVVIAVTATRAGSGRGRNRQRGDARGEE